MGNTKKGSKGKKGGGGSGEGPVFVALERDTAMDLFLALAQALGAPIDKKKKAKKGKGKAPKGPKGPSGPKSPKSQRL